MEVDAVEMGRRIAQRRKSFHLKQKELAEKLGVSNNHLSGIELGKASPSLDVFVRLCNELDVTPDYLLEGAMHSNNVPQSIMEHLRLCSEKNVALVAAITKFLAGYEQGQP